MTAEVVVVGAAIGLLKHAPLAPTAPCTAVPLTMLDPAGDDRAAAVASIDQPSAYGASLSPDRHGTHERRRRIG
ncbi:MAG: hypothetical protein WBG92_06515 [Thiohalocapsa sp.]